VKNPQLQNFLIKGTTMFSKSTAAWVITAILVSITAINPIYAGVVWSEEFDGPSIDTSKWTYDVGNWGFGNGELQYYTARPENATIEDGKLVITALRENYIGSGNSFSSARLKTQGRFAFKYGTIEGRIKVPNLANGLWPAFWLLGNNIGSHTWPKCGEMDILEMGMKSAITAGVVNKRHSSYMHWDYMDTYANYGTAIDDVANLNEDYHIYKLSWTPTVIKAYIDGVEFLAFDISSIEQNSLEEFHEPYFIIANLAVGGWNFVEIQDPGAITAPFPAKMYIDYIRVSDNAYTELYYNDDNVETGNFGVFTETTPVENHITYGTNAELYIWNNMTSATGTAFEGSEAWSFDVAAGTWFGMGVLCSPDRNMKNYSDGYLHFNMKTTSTANMKVGIKSAAAGESWLPLIDGGEFGPVRDGQWHEVVIPLNRFANIDFSVVTQIFMFAGDAPTSTFNVSIDNVYWSESVERPTPANGNFGVLTETAANKTAGEFVPTVNGNIYVWENTLTAATQTPYEGEGCLAFSSTTGMTWFGAAITPNVKYNLTAFSYPDSKLRFAMKTSSTTTFYIGMKSGNVDGIGQKWIKFESGSDPYGFARDGQWHVIEIPMADITNCVDLSEVSQLFELLGTTGAIGSIQIDDICFINGGSPISGGNVNPTISITSPSEGQIFNPGDNITITADAADSDGTVSKVEFYQGSTLLGQDLTAPYSFVWNNVAAGTYLITAKVTDNSDATRNATVRIYVGQPVLTSITVSPSTATVEIGQTKQFTASGLNQYGLPIAVDAEWSVTGGGTIDSTGLFTAASPGSQFAVVATDGAASGSANVMTYFAALPTGCTGGPTNGNYTYMVSNDSPNPTITFVPGRTGVGSTTCILYYNTSQYGVFPGYTVTPNTPKQITAAAGQTIYFYYTYSLPEGGQASTVASKHNFTVGQCGSAFPADLDGSEFVDFADFYILAAYWLEDGCSKSNANCSGADYQPDGKVDLKDLLVFADHWLK
jgi:beta-glucanase (GH16 family)